MHEGFGRTDALGRIGNTAFGDHLVAANYQAGDAPVSYPYLWNIWKFDWVQYNGSVSQPLARNVGEALGVGAIAPLRSDMREPLPPHAALSAARWTSPACTRIEHALQLLRPPRWPEEILGAVDRDEGRARRGAVRAALPGMPRPARRRTPRASRPARRSSPRRISSGASR